MIYKSRKNSTFLLCVLLLTSSTRIDHTTVNNDLKKRFILINNNDVLIPSEPPSTSVPTTLTITTTSTSATQSKTQATNGKETIKPKTDAESTIFEGETDYYLKTDYTADRKLNLSKTVYSDLTKMFHLLTYSLD